MSIGDCNCGAQDGDCHRPHAANCSVYKSEELTVKPERCKICGQFEKMQKIEINDCRSPDEMRAMPVEVKHT